MSKLTMDRVRGLELFSGCRRAQVRAIDRLGCVFEAPKGKLLCSEGAPGREFFVLASGTATMDAPSGAVAILHPGAWFGEIALMRDGFRQATVKTRTAATLLVFDHREFATLLEIAPEVRCRLQRSIELIDRADRPTVRPWFQPVRHARATRFALSV